MRRSLQALPPALIALLLLALLSVRAASAQVYEEGEYPHALGDLVAEVPGVSAAGGDPEAAGPQPVLRSLVLRRVSWDVEIVGPLASLVLEQEFVNDTGLVLEAAYRFPLPPGGAVAHYEMEVNDRVLTGVVREKARARAEFEAARAEGRRASLLEQTRPDVFDARVTNLSPGDAVRVRVVVALQVPFEDGVFRLRLPMTVGDRHGPAPSAPDHAPVVVPPQRAAAAALGRTTTVDVAFPAELAPVGITSPTHALANIPDADGWTRVGLARDDEAADRDFVLEYVLAGGAPVGALGPERDGWREALLLLTPPTAKRALPARPKELLVVLDTSGSMDNGSLAAAQRALAAVLDGLRPDELVDVIEYDNRWSRLFDTPQLADSTTLEKAKEFVGGLSAGGGTHLLPALVEALDTPASPTHHRVVVVLTDGFIGQDEEVLATLAEHLGDARLFVVGIGSAPNAHLAREMAELGRGTALFLSPGESVEDGARRLLARIERPLLWDLELDWHGAEVRDVFPRRLPDLHAGLPVAVLARVRDRGSVGVTVRGEGVLGAASFDVALDPARVAEHPVVSLLWARAAIEEIEDELRLVRGGAGDLTAEERDGRLADLRSELVDVSVEHQLASSETSFVVVETRRTARPGGPDAVHDAPAEPPAAWPKTASRRPVRLRIGFVLVVLGCALLVGAGGRRSVASWCSRA